LGDQVDEETKAFVTQLALSSEILKSI